MFTKAKQKITKIIPNPRIRLSLGAFAVCFMIAGVAAIFNYVNQPDLDSAVTKIDPTIRQEIPGWWLQEHFGTSVCDKEICKYDADPDLDKLTNEQEYYFKTNPLNPDTNKNGLSDGEDVAMGYDPSHAGRVSFDEVASDENILGESLVFSEDVKTMLNEMVDPTKIPLPMIMDSEVNISQNNSEESLKKYFNKTEEIVLQHLPKDYVKYIEEATQVQDDRTLADLNMRFAKTVIDLKQLEVPSKALQFHKYTLMMYRLLPIVLSPPPQEVLADEYNSAGNDWYQQTQAYAVLIQKMEIELNKIISNK